MQKVDERTKQIWRCESRRVRTHHSTSEAAVRRSGRIIQRNFSAQSGGSIGRAVWKWSGKSRFPGAFFALLVNLRRFVSLPDLFPLAPANRPRVSEDDMVRASHRYREVTGSNPVEVLNFTDF